MPFGQRKGGVQGGVQGGSSISESRNGKREYFDHHPNLGFLSSMQVSSENKY